MLTQIYETDAVGQYIKNITYLALLISLSSLGIDTFYQKKYYIQKSIDLIFALLLIKYLVSFIYFIFYYVLADLAGGLGLFLNIPLFCGLWLALPLLSFENILLQMEQTRSVVILKLTLSLIFSIIKVVMVWQNVSISMVVVIFVLEAIVLGLGLLGMFILVNKMKIDPSLSKFRTFFLSTIVELPFYMLANIAGYFSQRVELFISTLLMSNEFIIGFAIAFRFIDLILILPNSIAHLKFSALLRLDKTSVNVAITKIYRVFYILFIVSYLAFWLFGLQFLTVVFHEHADLIYSILLISLFNIIFITFGIFNARIYVIRNLRTLYATRGLIISIFQMMLSFLFFSLYGPYGVLIATLISFAIGHLFINLISKNTADLFWLSILMNQEAKN